MTVPQKRVGLAPTGRVDDNSQASAMILRGFSCHSPPL